MLLVSVSTVTQHANDLARFKQENKRRIVAAAALVDAGAPLVASVPAPEFDPELNATALATLSRDGKLPNIAVDTVDRLTAAEFLQLALGPEPAAGTSAQARIVGTEGAQVVPASRSGCFTVTPTSDHPTVLLEFAEPGWVELTSQRDGEITAQLQTPGARSEERGRERVWPTSGGRAQILSVSATEPWLGLGVVPEGTTDLCHVSGSTES